MLSSHVRFFLNLFLAREHRRSSVLLHSRSLLSSLELTEHVREIRLLAMLTNLNR